MISGEFKALSRQVTELERLRSRLLSRTALCGVISMGMFFGGGKPANAGPEGTVVVQGGVTVQKSGTHTQFNQSTNTAILNHSSFDIKSNESVHFQQPNARALAVNRVVGSDVSTTIAGKLTATGNVWVLNPSGVAISSTAQVNVNGLVASTARISDSDIMNGRDTGSFAFSGAADGSSVTNAGSITAGDGHVVLVAPVVENSGTITTQGSEIALGAGSGFTVDMDHDGLTRFEVQPGNGVSLTNTGTLSAQGGAVYLSADAANSVEGAVVSIGGQVEATRIENRGGQIVISGGDNGKVEVTGTIDASQVTGDGGQIVVTAQEVDIKETAVIDASGAQSGGKVEIGGGLQGRAVQSPVVRTASAAAPTGAPLPVAKKTTVREGAVIKANAGTEGDGGEIIVWSDQSTEFYGHLEAKGGSVSGNGGFAEVSGKQFLTFAGTVDLTAANGFFGELLLDPDDITISAAVDSANVLNVGTLLGLLNVGNVTISTSAPGLSAINSGADGTGMDAGNITIATAIATDITSTANGTGTTLTLDADNDITINFAITENSGNPLTVDFEADNNINVNANITTTGGVTLTADADTSGVGTIDFLGGGAVSGASVALSAGEALAVGAVTVSAASSTLNITTSNDNITQIAATTISTSSTTNTTLSAGTGNITLNEANSFASSDATGFVSVAGGVVSITDINSIDVSTESSVTSLAVTSTTGSIGTEGTIDASGNITLTAQSAISVEDNITSTTGDVALNADSDTTGNEDISIAGGVTVSANGTLSFLGGATSAIVDIVNASTETVSLVSGSDLTLLTTTFLEDNLSITAPDVNVPSAVSVPGTLTVINSAGDAVDLGTTDATAGTFDLDNTELARLTVGTLSVDSGGGTITSTAADMTTPTTIDATVLDASGGAGTAGIVFGTGASSFEVLTATAGSAGFTDTGTVSVTGNTTLTSTGAITLDGDNDFSGNSTDLLNISASGQTVVVNDVSDVVLGAVTVDTLTVTAGGTIGDSANMISVTGATSLSAVDSLGMNFFDILLDQTATHDFGGVVTATGEDIKLEDINALTLGAITTNSDGSADTSSNGLGPAGNNGDFIVFANGTVSDDGTTAMSISGETTINASSNDDVVLDNGTHTFTGLVDATGEQIQITVATGQTLNVGTLSVNGGTNDATLGQGSAQVVSLTEGGEELLITGGDLILTNPDFSGGSATADYVLLNYDAGSTVTGASLTNLTINNHLSLQSTGALTVSAASITAPTVSVVTSDAAALTAGETFTDGNDITFSGTNVITGNLRAVTGDDILQAGSSSVSVTGTTYLLAADNTVGSNAQEITLSESGNDFGSTVDAISSGAITLTDQDALVLGLVSAGFGETDTTGSGRNLTVTAGGTITQDDGTRQIFVRGDADGSGGTLVTDLDRAITSIALNDIEGARVEAADVASLSATASADVLLNNANNDFDRLVDTTGQAASLSGDAVEGVDVLGEDIALFDRDAIALGTITTTAGGADATSSGLGITNFTGDDGDLYVDAAGSITDPGGETLTILGSATLDATTGFDVLIENGGGSSTFTDAFFALGEQVSVRQSGTLTVGTITAGGGTSDATIGAADGDIFLTEGGEVISGADINLFNMDTSSGVLNAADILLTFDSAQTVNTTFMTGLNATNSLSVRTTGTNDITVDGVTTTIPTVTFATSDLTAGSVGNSTGGNIAFDTSASSFASLRAISGGNISQSAGISTSGTAFFLAADSTLAGTLQTITLNNSANDFQSTVDALASGAISLRDTDAIELGVVSAGYLETATAETARTLNVQAGTTISQQNLTTQAGGTGTATSGGRAIAVRGDADTTPGTLGTELEGARVEVADATTLTAGGTIDLDQGADISNSDAVDNNFDRVVDTSVATGNLAGDAVDTVTISASGQAVTIVDEDGIALSAVTAASLNVGAGGTITDTSGQSIVVTGTTSLVALNDQGNASAADDEYFDILLDNVDTHDFGGSFNATGEDIVVDDTNALTLGAINAVDTLTADTTSDALTGSITNLTGNDGDFIVNAGSTITDTGGQVITVAGTASITAVDSVGTTFADIDLNETHAFSTTDPTHASGEQVRIATTPSAIAGTITSSGATNDATLASSQVFLTETGELLGVNVGDIDLSGFDISSATLTGSVVASRAAASFTGDLNSIFSGASHVHLESNGAGITLNGVELTVATLTVSTSNIAADASGSTFTEGDDITFSGSSTITGDLRAVSGDDILQTGGSSVSVTGTTYLLAADSVVGTNVQDITLDQSGNSFGGIVDAVASNSISLTDSGSIDLGLVSAGFGETDTSGSGRNLTISSGGDITQQAPTGRQIFVRGDADGAGGVVVTDLDRAITSIATNDIEGSRVEAADIASFTASSGNITLSGANNDFDRLSSVAPDAVHEVDAAAGNIVLNDRDAIALGIVTATTNLTVTAEGSITDTGTDAISVTGTTSLLAYDDMGNGAGSDDDFFDIALDNDAHNFGGAVSATGEDITLTDTGAILLGAISTNEGAQTDLITPNAANLGADTDQDVSVDATIATNAGDLVVRTGGAAAGDITQDSSGLFIEGSTSLSAGSGSGDVTLTEATNDFDQDAEEIDNTLANFGDAVDEVDILADVVQITDDTAIALGSVTAGTLTVTSGGTMTDTASEGILVSGVTTLTAQDGSNSYDILLDNADLHNFDSDAGAANDATDGVFATGEDIVIDDLDALNLAAITTTIVGASDTSSDVLTGTLSNLTGNDGDLIVTTNGSITDTTGQTITVVNTTSLDATSSFDILIANNSGAGEDTGSHTFGSSFHANGEQIRIRQSGTLTQGTITGTAGTTDSTISESAGDIFLTEGGEVISGAHVDLENITLGGIGSITAPDVLLTFDSATTVVDATVDAVMASNVLTFRTTGTNTITVDGVTTTIPTLSFVTSDLAAGSTGNSTGGDIAFNSTASSFVNLRAISGGNISQTAGMSATGTSYFLAADNTVAGTLQTITLDNAANDFQSSVDAIASGAVSLRDTNGIDLGLVSAGFGETDTSASGRTLAVTSGGDITQQAPTSREVFVRGDADGTGGTTVTDLDRAITAITTNDLEGARVEAAGATSLTATSGNITLSAANNDFDRLSASDPDAIDDVDASSANILLTDRDAIALGAIISTGDLTVTTSGSITDTGSEAVSVNGATTLTAGSGATLFDIALDNAAHDFDSDDNGGAVTAIGEDITLSDVDAIILARVEATDDAVSDTTINSFGDAFGTGTTLTNAEGNLVVISGGNITDDGTANGVQVQGRTRLDANSGASEVVLDTAGAHNFDSDAGVTADAAHEVDVRGTTVTLVDSDAIALGDVTVTANLSVTAGGTISDTDTDVAAGDDVEAISVTGTTSLTAQAGGDFFDVVLDDDADLANGAVHDFGGAVSINAEDINVVDLDGISIGTITANSDIGAPDASISNGNDGDLTLVARGGAIVDTTGAITVGGTTSLTAQNVAGTTSYDIQLDGATSQTAENTHDFSASNPFNAVGGDIEIDESNGFQIGNVTANANSDATLTLAGSGTGTTGDAGNLLVQTGGDLVQAASTVITVPGTTAIDASLITLDQSNLFTGAVDAAGTTITLTDANDIILGDIDASSDFIVTAGSSSVSGTIDDGTAAGDTLDIDVTGITTLNAEGTITVDDATNNFTTLVADSDTDGSGTKANISVGDEDAIVLGNIDAANLTVQTYTASTGTITQVGSSTILSTGTADFVTEDSEINVSQMTNDFATLTANTDSDADNLARANVTIYDTTAITLGAIEAQDLLVTSEGTMDNNGGAIIAGGTTSLLASDAGDFFDIRLNGTSNEFVGEITASGEDIALVNTVATTLGNITASAGAGTTDTTISTGNDGDFSLTVTGSGLGVSQTGGDSIIAPGHSDIVTETGAVTLDGTSNDFGTIDVETDDAGAGDNFADVILTDANAIDLGVIEAAGLTVTAGGTISDNATGAISVSGITSLTAQSGGEFFDILLDDVDTHNFDSDGTGDGLFASGEDIVLDDQDALVLGAITTNDDATADTASDALGLTNVTGNDGDFVVQTNGAITDTSGQVIMVADVTSLDATSSFDIVLDGTTSGTQENAHDFSATSSFFANGGDIEIDESNGFQIGDVTAASNSDVTLTLLGSGTGTVSNAGNILIQTGGDLVQAASTVITVPGTTAIDGSAITLNQSNQFTGAVDANGTTITLTDANDIVLGDIDATGDLIVTAGSPTVAGTIDDGSAAGDTLDIDVTGSTTLNAEGAITMDDATNNFTTLVADSDTDDSGTKADITIGDEDAIILANVDAANLSVRTYSASTGTITQSAGTSIVSSGTADFITEDSEIALSETANEFATITANTDIDGDDLARANVTIYDTSAVTLGAIEAQDLLVTSEGTMVDTGDAIVVGGTTSLLANDAGNFFDIQLDGTTNQFVGEVTASGEDIALVNTLATTLGNVTVRADAATPDTTISSGQDGDFSLTVSGSGLAVSQAAGDSITAPGLTTIDTEIGAVTLSESGNDFGSINVDTDNVAAGDNFAAVTLNDVNAIDLGGVTASSLTVTAGGTISDDEVGAISVSGLTSLTAQSGANFFDIVLDDANTHDFDSDNTGDGVYATGEDIVLDDQDAIVLGAITANSDATPDTTYNVGNDGDLVVRAGGTITDISGQSITLGDDASFASDGSGTGTEVLIQSMGANGVVNLTGANNVIALNSGNLTLGTTSLSGDTVFDALTGNVVVTGSHTVSGGSLFLISETGDIDLSGMVPTGASFTASEAVALLAPNGSIIMPTNVVETGLNIVAGATGPSLSIGTQLGNSSVNSSLVTGVTESVEFEFAEDMLITIPNGANVASGGVLDFDTTGTVKFTINNGAEFAIGEDDLTSQVGTLSFDPVQFAGLLRNDELLFSTTGSFHLVIDGGTSTFNVQNTNGGLSGANQGAGTQVTNDITLEQANGGILLQYAAFGDVNGRSGTSAAIGTVTLVNFTPDQNHTINGCVIGTVSSCTPLGTLTLNLQFETGQFLGITFVDPDEDEDDPFTNRGDEEEWE